MTQALTAFREALPPVRLRSITADIIESLWSNQAQQRRVRAERSLAGLREILAPNRGLRGKAFEKVLVGAINSRDTRLLTVLIPVLGNARIPIDDNLAALHVAFEQPDAAAWIRRRMDRHGWNTTSIQYLDARRGKPIDLAPQLDQLARSFYRPLLETDRLFGAEKADLWIGNKDCALIDRSTMKPRSTSRARVIGVTVKLTEGLVDAAPSTFNLRAAMFGGGDRPAAIDQNGMWRVPVPAALMADFNAAWKVALSVLRPTWVSDDEDSAIASNPRTSLLRNYLRRHDCDRLSLLLWRLRRPAWRLDRIREVRAREVDVLFSDPARGSAWLPRDSQRAVTADPDGDNRLNGDRGSSYIVPDAYAMKHRFSKTVRS